MGVRAGRAAFLAACGGIVACSGAPDLPPIARAGQDLILEPGLAGTLDGRASIDPDGLSLSWEWTMLTGSAATPPSFTDTGTPQPTFVAAEPGDYVVSLRVFDADGLPSRPDLLAISVPDGVALPHAALSAPSTASTGSQVHFDGAGSFDPEGDALRFQFDLLVQPPGSRAQLDDGLLPSEVRLTPDKAGTWIVALSVSDGATTSPRIEARVDVSGPNDDTPIGEPDEDGGSDGGSEGLNNHRPEWGRQFGDNPDSEDPDSEDPDNEDPHGEDPDSEDPDSEDPDSEDPDSEDPDSEDPGNTAPISEAGDHQAVEVDDVVALDGSGSSDPDGDALTWRWWVSSRPTAGEAEVTAASGSQALLIPDAPGAWVLSLEVDDGQATAVDTMVIVVTDPSASTDDAEDDAEDDDAEDDTDLTSPTVTVLSPSSGELIDQPWARVDGEAWDDVGLLSVEVDGIEAIATDGDLSRWTAFVPLSAGEQDLEVVVTDTSGNTGHTSVSVSQNSADCADGAVLQLRFDEPDAGTAEDDGNGLHGTEIGTGRAPGKHGNAATFDGNSDVWVPGDPVLQLDSGFTLELWTRTAGATESPQVLVSLGDDVETSLVIDGETLSFGTVDGAGIAHAAMGRGVTDGAWHHVAGVWDGQRLRLHVDGRLVDHHIPAVAPALGSGEVYLGSHRGAERFFEGAMDSVRILDDVLDVGQVAEAAASGPPCSWGAQLSRDAVAAASGSLNAQVPAWRVNDGHTAENRAVDLSMWLLPDNTTGWVELDLGRVSGLTSVRWLPTQSPNTQRRAGTQFEVAVSTTGSFTGEETVLVTDTWDPADDRSWRGVQVDTPLPGRFVRVWVDDWDGPGGGLNELDVRGIP